MNRRLETCLVSLIAAAIPGVMFAQQSGGTVPLQRGVSVQMPVTSNAVAVPNANTEDALVVALTADGTAYLRADRLPTFALAERVRSILSTRKEKRSTSRRTRAFRMRTSLRLSMRCKTRASKA